MSRSGSAHGPLLPALVAAGCVTLEQRWSGRRLFVAGTVLVVVAAVGWPAALPLLPARVFAGSPYATIGEDQLETIGWPELVAAVGDAVDAAGPGAVVFTGNYGEAGAGEWYGVGAPVYSGHNGFGDWGPPPEGSGPVVVLGYRDPSTDFSGCSPAGRVRNSAGAANEEEGGTVWVCEGPIGGWAAGWPRLRHLDA